MVRAASRRRAKGRLRRMEERRRAWAVFIVGLVAVRGGNWPNWREEGGMDWWVWVRRVGVVGKRGGRRVWCRVWSMGRGGRWGWL